MAKGAVRGSTRTALTDASSGVLTVTVLGRTLRPAQALHANTGGTVQVKGPGDSSFTTHTIADGGELIGEFIEYDLTAVGAATGVVAIY